MGRFFLRKGDAEGEITYRLNDGVLSLDHTGVDEALEGTGVGRALVMHAAAWARSEGLKIRANCGFAARVLERSDDFSDLLVSRRHSSSADEDESND